MRMASANCRLDDPRMSHRHHAVVWIDQEQARLVNVVDLFRLVADTEPPYGLSDRDFESLFTTDRPVIFNFHSYASLMQRTGAHAKEWLREQIIEHVNYAHTEGIDKAEIRNW